MTLLPDEQAAERIRHERQRHGLCDPPCRADQQRHASFEMDPVLVAVEQAVEKNWLAARQELTRLAATNVRPSPGPPGRFEVA
jgi:hypothetical protein